MLIPLNTSGAKAPMFLLHGNTGFMPIGTVFAHVMGPEQPVYVLNAKGFDGSAPHETVPDMVADYLADVLSVTPTGPLVIVAQCWGSLVALELANELITRGCELAPVILLDPPRVPFGKPVEVSEETTNQLYEYTRGVLVKLSQIWFLELPFDVDDPDQLHNAVLTGMASITATSRFTPQPFLGTAELILSTEMAPPFFGPARPWRKILPNPPMIHVLPYGHSEMLHNYRFDLARLVRLMLQWHARRGKAGPAPVQNRFEESRLG